MHRTSGPFDPEVLRRPALLEEYGRRVARTCAAFAVAVGLAVLAGWTFDVRPLMRVLPGQVAMVPNTAVAFVLMGLALWARTRRGERSPARTAVVPAVLAGLLGLLNLVEYLSGRSLGIDELLFRDPGGLTSAFPGRMAVLTAVGFVTLAAALLTLEFPRAPWATDGLALLPGFLALASLTGYGFGVGSLRVIGEYKGMAIHTAIAFLALALGVLLVHPGGLSRLLVSDSAGGVVARRVLPIALLVPFALGWVRVEGQRLGLYGPQFGRTLESVSNAVVLTAALLVVAALLRRADERRRVSEEAARAAEANYRLLFESSPLPMWVVDRETLRYLAVNDAAVQHYGYSREEFLSMHIGHLRPAADFPAVKAAVPKEESGLARLGVWRHLKKDGTLIQVDVATHTLVFEGRSAWLALAYDVTDRLRAEESLRKLSRAVEQSPVSVVITDTNGDIEYVNPKFTEATGYSAAEVRGMNSRILKSGEQSPEVYRTLWETITAGREWRGEFHNVRKNGELFWELASISPVTDESGRITHFVAVKEDVTQRKFAEEALARREQHFRSLIENARDVITIIDAQGTIRFQSPAAERILGRPPEEFVGRSAFEFVHPDDAAGVEAAGRRLVENPGATETAVFRFRHANGSWRTLEGIGTLLPGDGSGQIVVNSRDVTESRAVEEQLRQAQKMEAVGRLAGGIAHDFNNLLTAIMGYGDLATSRLSPGDPARAELAEIDRAAHRAADLTRQLLAFSRKQVLQPRVISLNAIVSDTDRMLRRLIGEDIELVTRLNEPLGSVKADTGQVEQVLVNLAVNARDAMPRGGKLTIETSDVDLGTSGSAFHLDAPPGRYVLLAVSDSGTGMDASTLSHVFEPFFTTKPAGRGTGLGLSMVYGVVKQSGGHVTVYSEPGVGTAFKIYLPRVEDAPEKSLATSGPAAPAGGTETILVVEDEEAVRRLTCRALEIQGYTVLAAANADEAAVLSETHAGEIDLMVTDVVMPQTSGRTVAERAVARRPRMKVLFMSGYTDDAIVRHGVLDAGTAFLQKPFTPVSLGRKVRDVLDAKTGDSTDQG